jgi:hypothetical protein
MHIFALHAHFLDCMHIFALHAHFLDCRHIFWTACTFFGLQAHFVQTKRAYFRVKHTVSKDRQVPNSQTGLPDFSWRNIPQWGEIYQIAAKLPNGHKVYQITYSSILQMATEDTNLLHSKALQNLPGLGFLV